MKKKIRDFHKYIVGCIIGIIIVGSISAYAVTTIIDSKEVSYDNEKSKGSYDNVQLSIDELYKRYKDLSGEQDTIYTEEILNGADPVLGKDMIPITLDAKGNVKYANLYTPWYKYEEKRWANAVILVDSPSQTYKTGDTILEKDIESYFVWIPRYSYKIWNLGNYNFTYSLDEIDANLKITNTPNEATSLRHIAGNRILIDIRFGKNENETKQQLNSYYTHPAFTNFGVSGLWIGKFETGYNQSTIGKPIENISEWIPSEAQKDILSSDNIIIKPNVYSWRSQTIGKIFKSAYNYNRTLDSHMMKNTEWGAVAYLSHSIYGKASKLNINNNSDYKTGYSSASHNSQEGYDSGVCGTTEDVTKPWNTITGHLASTTGNITGIYDIGGGAHELLAAYLQGYGVTNDIGLSSGLTSDDLNTYAKYFDVYEKTNNNYEYTKRILGDATGELGPFYTYYEKNSAQYPHSSWYLEDARFLSPGYPWFSRGGHNSYGNMAGAFSFAADSGPLESYCSSRLVLAVK